MNEEKVLTKEEELEAQLKTENREVRRLRATLRQQKRTLKLYEKEADLVDGILRIVRDSFDSMEEIKPPELITLGEAEHDETALLLVSDVHVGKKTNSYNHNVFAKRLRQLGERVMGTIGPLRSIRPIRKMVLVFNGDLVDNESIYPSQSVDYVSAPVLDQIFTHALPNFIEFIHLMLANFEEVEIYATKGNHGRINQAKWVSSKSTNWDLVLYKALEVATKGQERLTWHIADKDWKHLFRINGWGFLACHGDMIKRYYSVPFYGQTRQALRWANVYSNRIKLTYFLYSHFHNINCGTQFSQITFFSNGSFVTDDVFAEEVLAVASIPAQLLIGVHPRYGVTWRYALQLK